MDWGKRNILDGEKPDLKRSVPFRWSKAPLENLDDPLPEEEVKEDGHVLYVYDQNLYFGVYDEDSDEVLRKKIT